MTKLTVPGIQPLPVFGRTILVSKFVKDSLGFTSQLFQKYGKLVSLARGGSTNLYSPLPNCPGTVFTYGAQNVQTVTSQHEIYHKYPLTGGLYSRRDESPRTEPLKHFGVGLFGVNNDEHRRHRQLLMPAFHQKRIEYYCNTFKEITESISQQIEVNKVTDIAKLMRMLTLRIATKTLFGADIGEKGSKSAELLKQIGILLGNPTTMVFPFDLPGFPFYRMMNLMAELDEDMREIIRSRKASDSDTGDVLSMLIKASDAETGMTLSEDELLGHVSVIFAAGHETSANALTWTLFLLSQHPEVAADLLDELDTVLQGEAPTIEQLQQLPLLERVIKESMRILTPVPWNARATSQPTTLEGYELPTGTEVWVSIFHTHRTPDIYPEPLKFNPQRWETLEVDNFQYNPFSAGSRKCIGAGFALMEIKIVLAMLLQKFRFQCLPQQKITRSALIVLAPKGGLPMLICPQDREFSQGVGGLRGNIRELVELQ
ncbi:cytochrome P450 [Rivularia sp. PCC 7116]|uniref:cytochrome P450 n=1 Tax=Rivularia sp. PCC 7116 TaxID=373994 RepID=UPI00029EFE57|nr:cytochrome P450 [Rivularia sp. PCC 7116]AFY53209.1 cytochrome P450 [Rivularia sp. PCC 7116]